MIDMCKVECGVCEKCFPNGERFPRFMPGGSGRPPATECQGRHFQCLAVDGGIYMAIAEHLDSSHRAGSKEYGYLYLMSGVLHGYFSDLKTCSYYTWDAYLQAVAIASGFSSPKAQEVIKVSAALTLSIYSLEIVLLRCPHKLSHITLNIHRE